MDGVTSAITGRAVTNFPQYLTTAQNNGIINIAKERDKQAMSEDKNKTTQPYKVYSKPDLTWVNITSPSSEVLAEVKRRFPFLLDIDIRDCLPPYQRPKLMERKEYLFMVLLFPAYYKKEGRIKVKELDIFIGPNFLITSHTGDLEALQHMAACYNENTPICPP